MLRRRVAASSAELEGVLGWLKVQEDLKKRSKTTDTDGDDSDEDDKKKKGDGKGRKAKE